MKISAISILIFASFWAHAKNVDILMKNNGADGIMTFEPAFVQVQPGDTVTFVPTDAAHSSSSAFIPAGAKPWNGKMDEKVKVKLEKEGIYIYKCEQHLAMAMAGIIQVGKATNLDAAKQEVEKISKAFVMNKDRLQKQVAKAK